MVSGSGSLAQLLVACDTYYGGDDCVIISAHGFASQVEAPKLNEFNCTQLLHALAEHRTPKAGNNAPRGY